MERQAGGNLDAAYPRSRNLQGRRDLAGDAGHQRSPESHWVRPAGFVFRSWRRQDLFELYRPEAPGSGV